MPFVKRVAPALILGLAGGLLAGCAVVPQGGMAERCTRLMHEAYPGADIKITGSEVAATGLTTIIAKVEGVRSDLPAGSLLPRQVAVECRFDHAIMTGFRWTEGPNR